jgi:hypothetical protein
MRSPVVVSPSPPMELGDIEQAQNHFQKALEMGAGGSAQLG